VLKSIWLQANIGAPGGDRILDIRITSTALCYLSYKGKLKFPNQLALLVFHHPVPKRQDIQSLVT